MFKTDYKELKQKIMEFSFVANFFWSNSYLQ